MNYQTPQPGFAGCTIGVLGGGVTGVAAARLLLKLGAKVVLSDRMRHERTTPELRELEQQGVVLELAQHGDALYECEAVVVSPGIASTLPLFRELQDRDIALWSELELALCQLPKLPICAVTGTNGKTTTTALIGHLLQSSHKRVFVGGNIGRPLSELSLEYHASGLLPEYIVLELSSFQIEQLVSLRAEVAVYLNLSPDHFDRYINMDAYEAAKRRLFMLQDRDDTAVLNRDDVYIQKLKSVVASRVVEFSVRQSLAEGAYLEPPSVAVLPHEHSTLRLERGALFGLHNRQNQLAAILAARALSCEIPTIQSGLDSFLGVEHRLEKIATLGGVTYYNDSKATNDDASAKALASFSQPLIWIAGGRDKKGGYAASCEQVASKVKLALLFGEAAPLIDEAIKSKCATERVVDLAAAVRRAHAVAKQGDVVLFSPACASFDQFENYQQRGQVFRMLVDGVAK